MANEKINWSALELELKTEIEDVGRILLQGAQSDLTNFARAITASMLVAVQRQDAARLEELKAQLAAIGEVNKLRAIAGMQGVAWKLIGKTLDVVFNVLTRTV